MYGGVEVAVETKDMQLLVVLVFVDSFQRNLDDRVDYLGGIRAHRKLKVVHHKFGFSSLRYCKV
jgi:hypothetical protein